ncbi:MAG: T9SS type A sorting domain-containing protein, partial [Flavobacteriales bacterium]|nr:T9SS type A sorting domain-containing protein [Flavobacteriales bacterium]
ANSVYGVTFSLNYDPALIDTSSVQVSYTNSWLGDITNNNDMIALEKNTPSSGKVDIGMTRTDKSNISGMGEICAVDIFITDDLSGKQAIYETLQLVISNVKIISYDETEIPVNLISDSVVVTDEASLNVVNDVLEDQIRLYPNPSNGTFRIEGIKDVYPVSIHNTTGQQVFSGQVSKEIIQLDLEKGMYFVNIDLGGQIETKKLIVQ